MLGTLRRPCVCTLLERGVALCQAGLGTAPRRPCSLPVPVTACSFSQCLSPFPYYWTGPGDLRPLIFDVSAVTVLGCHGLHPCKTELGGRLCPDCSMDRLWPVSLPPHGLSVV